MNFTAINSLWSLENIRDGYVVCYENKFIYDIRCTPYKLLKLHPDFQGYLVVSLYQQNSKLPVKNIFYHKILALAFINNGPYELIEHLDDDKLNNDISNLRFSNKRDNGLRAFANNKHVHKSSIFEFCMEDGTIYRGKISEISKQSGIPAGTLYDRIYTERPCKSRRTKYRFKYIKELEYGTTRGYNAKNNKLVPIPDQHF